MNKEWVAKKQRENSILLETAWSDFEKKLRGSDLIDDTDVKEIMARMRLDVKHDVYISAYRTLLYVKYRHKELSESQEAYRDWNDKLYSIEFSIHAFADKMLDLSRRNYDRYLDSEPMEFDGDIIITDPCYIVDESRRGDWEHCGCGGDMQQLGIHHYMTRDTLYGDWSCTVYDTNTKKKIGGFCADAGMVGVFLLDEVHKYNPKFDWYTSRPWTTALIKDFKGTVQFVVKEETGVYEDEGTYHHKGDTWTDYSVEVIGHGVNKVTGKPIDFIGTQTGL